MACLGCRLGGVLTAHAAIAWFVGTSSVVPLCDAHLIYSALDILWSRRTTRNDIWKERTEGARRVKRAPGLHYKLTQSGTFDILPHSNDVPFTIHSIQDALRTYFQPIKNDNTRLDFYTMYKREATKYNTYYVKKYDEDLNTTLIFVCCTSFAPVGHLTQPRRRGCSLPSALPSSSMSTRACDPIRMSNPRLSSAQSSSPSINPLFRMRPPLFRPPRKILPQRLSRPPLSCMRVW